jgi:site-specific DNA recombinase
MKAIGYFRVASDVEHGVTYTLKEQERVFSQFCSDNGHEPVTAFVDLDSGLRVSGTQYRSMLAYFWKHKGDYIVVIKSMRHLHPDSQELIRCLIELDVMGVQVHFIDSLRGEPLSVALRNWSEQSHGDKTGERVKEAMKLRAVRGRGLGKPPFGYRIGIDHKFELVPEEAETIALIFRLYLEENKGVRLIARYLNERQITTRSGGRWSIVGVRDILRNRSYVGTSSRFGLRVPGSHPAIVQFQAFEKVQERLTAHASHRNHVEKAPFMLSGMVYCSRCNNRMTGMNRNQSWTSKKSGIKHRGEYRYYQCQSRTNQSYCRYNTRKAEDLESAVKADLQRLSRPENREKLVAGVPYASDPQTSEQPYLRKTIKSLERRFRTILGKAARGEVTVDELRETGGEIVRERRLAEDRLNRIWAEARGEITSEQRREYTFRDLDDLLARWDSLDLPAKRSLMRNVINRIIVHDDYIETVLWL